MELQRRSQARNLNTAAWDQSTDSCFLTPRLEEQNRQSGLLRLPCMMRTSID